MLDSRDLDTSCCRTQYDNKIHSPRNDGVECYSCALRKFKIFSNSHESHNDKRSTLH